MLQLDAEMSSARQKKKEHQRRARPTTIPILVQIRIVVGRAAMWGSFGWSHLCFQTTFRQFLAKGRLFFGERSSEFLAKGRLFFGLPTLDAGKHRARPPRRPTHSPARGRRP